ncbi:hypothetical protein FQN49_006343 [Arthroderma sp. PD_2]|nr:hypothetical protein FQN49_006343 [Arthroderma sp. PD_2]
MNNSSGAGRFKYPDNYKTILTNNQLSNIKEVVQVCGVRRKFNLMQVAGVLSDLASLRACDQSDALSLVSIHKTVLDPKSTSQPADSKAGQIHGHSQNQDVQRATELVELHKSMKEHHIYQNGGVDAGLRRARMDVEGVLEKLNRS